MKKFNPRIILFIAAAAFILLGMASSSLVAELDLSLKGLYWDVMSLDPAAFTNFTAKVDNTAGFLRYRNWLLDLDSVKENFLGTRVVFSDDTTVVKADSGNLLGFLISTPPTVENVQPTVNNIKRIQSIAEKNGAFFLCCTVVENTTYENLPPNILGYDEEYYQMTLAELEKADVPTMSTAQVFEELGLTGNEIFFKTDHHWTPKAGLYVSSAICSELQERYGFEYNPEYADLNHYKVETYPNCFLGSLGKKVGKYFTASQLEDFDLITPLFETSFVKEIPCRNSVISGSFYDTMLYPRYLSKDYYTVNMYATYSGGDFRLQKITNNNHPDGETIVIISTSYGCVVTPFLAVHAKELHIIDDREGSYPSGERVDLEEYFQSVQPDYVIVLFST